MPSETTIGPLPVSPDLKQALEDQAQRENVKLTELVRKALASYLQRPGLAAYARPGASRSIDRNQIIRLRMEGMTQVEIARTLGCSERQVRRICQSAHLGS